MSSYVKITDDIFALENTPDPKEFVVKSEKLAELAEVERQIAEQEVQPDMILMSNDSKMQALRELNEQKGKLEIIINGLV